MTAGVARDAAGLAATLSNWAGLETAMARRFGGAIRADDRGFRFRSGLRSGFTDAVLRTTVAPAAVPALAEEVRAWFPRDSAWRWLVSALDRPADLDARLAAVGLQRMPRLPAMTLDLADFDVSARTMLDVADVQTPTDLAAWLTVRDANHPLDVTTRDAWFGTQAPASDGAFRQFVARTRDGRPVGSLTLFVHGETAGLYHVDVVPDARGHGVGTAMSAAAIDAAKKAGARLAVLTATDLGLPLYRRLGFAEVGDVEVFGEAA